MERWPLWGGEGVISQFFDMFILLSSCLLYLIMVIQSYIIIIILYKVKKNTQKNLNNVLKSHWVKFHDHSRLFHQLVKKNGHCREIILAVGYTF